MINIRQHSTTRSFTSNYSARTVLLQQNRSHPLTHLIRTHVGLKSRLRARLALLSATGQTVLLDSLLLTQLSLMSPSRYTFVQYVMLFKLNPKSLVVPCLHAWQQILHHTAESIQCFSLLSMIYPRNPPERFYTVCIVVYPLSLYVVHLSLFTDTHDLKPTSLSHLEGSPISQVSAPQRHKKLLGTRRVRANNSS